MIVLAFDGIVADTLALRGKALIEAIARVGDSGARQQPTDTTIATLLPGRTFYEVARELQQTDALVGNATSIGARTAHTVDETWCDLVAHAAQQQQSLAMNHGASFTEAFRVWRPAARAAHTHWVLRADSLRRDVEQWLTLTGMEHDFRMVRCADDLPRDAARSSIANSYRNIYHRSIGNRVHSHSAPHPAPTVVELSDYARRAATDYFSEVSPETDATPVVLSSLPDTR